MIDQVERTALLLATLLVLGLHVVNLFSAGPLWRDEVGDAVYAAMPSWAHVWGMLKYDNFPPLLLVLLRIWRGLGLENLGGPDFGYRIYGLIVGVAVLAVLWINAQRLGGPRNAPWFSLGLFAAGGFVVRVGDSIRPYGLGWLCILLTLGLVWRVVQLPRPGRVVAAAVMATLSVQALYQNAFLLLAIGLAGMLAAARAGRYRALAALAGINSVAVLSLLPYVLGPIHAASAWSMVAQRGVPWSRLGSMLWEAAGSLDRRWVPCLWLLAIGAVTYGGWALPRPGTAGRRQVGTQPLPDMRWYGMATVLIGLPVFLAFLKFLGMETPPWYYLLPLAVAASVLDGLGAAMTQDMRWRAGRVAFLAVALCLGLPLGWQVVQVRVTNADVAAAQATRLVQPGDEVLVAPWTDGVSFQYYYHGSEPWTTLPPLADHSIHRYDLMKDRIMAPDGVSPLLAQLGETLRAGHRVWIVGSVDAPPEGKAPPQLLPAPRDPRAGWDEALYMRVWTLQVGDYLRAHGERQADVPMPINQRVSRLEDIKLTCVEGWRP